MSRYGRSKKQTAGETLKSLCLRLKTHKEIAYVEDFQQVAVFNGRSIKDVVIGLVKSYSANHRPEFKLATQQDVLDLAASLGCPTTHGTLKKWRRIGALVEKTHWFQNPEGSIVYNRDEVRKFLMGRKKAPYSRLVPKVEAGVDA
jgi:hypothetical protein